MADKIASPQFDPKGVAFPADKITIGQMRQHNPGAFEHESLLSHGATNLDGLATHCWEQYLAEKAFARALHLPDPHPTSERSEIVAMLNDAYRYYGISSGMQQTRQLAREIEAEAKRQAETVRGKSR